MSTPETHTVTGTLFSFPELAGPEISGAELHAKFTAKRQAILDKAAAVKFKPQAKPRPFRGPKAGNGEFTPKPGDPGSTFHGYEVWALAPRGCRWVVDGQDFVLLTADGTERQRLRPGDQAARVVDEAVKRWAELAARRLVPAPEDARWGTPGFQELNTRRGRAQRWYRAKIAHELYPSRYPHPGEFDAEAVAA